MPDFDRLLSQQRNTLLGPEKTTGDIVRAGIQSTTGTPYAENLSNITTDRYNRALSQYGVLSNERDFETRRDQQMWQRAQAEAERGDANVKRLLELSSAYGANAAESQRLASWVIQQAEERNVDDPEQVPGLVAEGAAALGLPARPELTLMSTAGGGVTGIDPLGGTRTIVEGETAAPKPYTDIGKINADVTANLITPAQGLQAARDLYADEGETWRPMTAEERPAYGIPEGQAAQISSRGKGATIGSQGVTVYGEDGNPLVQIGGTPLTPPQQGKLAQEIDENIRQANERLSELNNTLSSLEEAGPKAAGISGALISGVGGLLQQAANFFGSDGKWLPTAEVQAVRSELAALFGRYIPTVTAEEGGRYTEGDVARAALALPLVQSPTASYGQVVSALETMRDIEIRSRGRERMRQAGFPSHVDLTYTEGQIEYVMELRDSENLSLDQATNKVFDIMEQYGIPIVVQGLRSG